MEVLEGVIEPVEPLQIGPGNAPGPMEPVVIDRVEAARQCKTELSERYPGTTFSVTTDRIDYPAMRIRWDDGPEREEVEVIAREYLGWYDNSDPQYDIYSYAPLPGKWIGGIFGRFDIAYIMYDRGTSEGMAKALRDWRGIWDGHQDVRLVPEGHALVASRFRLLSVTDVRLAGTDYTGRFTREHLERSIALVRPTLAQILGGRPRCSPLR